MARSCSASAGGSPPTRRSSSCAWRRRRATRSASSRRPTAQRFVGAASFAALTGAPVLTDEFERDPARGRVPRPARRPTTSRSATSSSSRNADAFLIAPASANTIAKLAHGLADNLLTSAALAATCPVLVAPAMNNHMYEHAATQANLATLRERGVTVLDPGVGALGSKGEWGVGRLAEPPDLLRRRRGRRCPAPPPHRRRPARPRHRRRHARADRLGPLRRQPQLAAGWASRSPRRPPRSARTSPSSRRTSASSAARASATSTSRPPPSCKAACEAEFPAADVLLMAAAVADFRPAEAAATKLKKDRPRDAHADARAHRRHHQRARGRAPPGPDARRLRRRARRGRGRLRPRQADAQGPRRRRRQRHRAGRTSASRASRTR